MEIWYFLYICINAAKVIFPFWQTNKDTLVPKKYTSGITEKDDIHPRKYGISVGVPYLLTFQKAFTKQPPEVFYKKKCSQKFCKIHRKRPVLDLSFNKVTGLRPATKKRLWCRCFPVNFAKFLRTSFSQNTSGRHLLEFH